MSSSISMLLAAVGYRNGKYSRFVQTADELASTARDLRVKLEAYQRAPDPFGALISDMHNNHEFEKSLNEPLTSARRRV